MNNDVKTTGTITIPNDSKVQFFNLPTVEIEQGRYERLIAAETELHFLKMALCTSNGYSSDIDRIKEQFNIVKKGNENE